MTEGMQKEQFNQFDLHGKTALITGGHSWLGFDMACALAEAGCNIVLAARSEGKLNEAAEVLRTDYGVEVLTIPTDQCIYDQVEAMAERALAWNGQIDILINNAGGGSGAAEGNFFLRSPEAVTSLIHTNLLGPLFCCQTVGRRMAERKSGKIINIGSVAGLVGRNREMYRRNEKTEQPVDYAASKAGVIGMTRDLAAFMAPYGIQVNCISPGGFDKGDLPEGFVSDYGKSAMAGRMGKMGNDIKGAALFLASSASDYVTGHNLVVDGGFSVYK